MTDSSSSVRASRNRSRPPLSGRVLLLLAGAGVGVIGVVLLLTGDFPVAPRLLVSPPIPEEAVATAAGTSGAACGEGRFLYVAPDGGLAIPGTSGASGFRVSDLRQKSSTPLRHRLLRAEPTRVPS